MIMPCGWLIPPARIYFQGMVKFNELGITRDGKHLVIDVAIRDLDELKDVYIDEIFVINHHNYVDGGDLHDMCTFSIPFYNPEDGYEKKKSVTYTLDDVDIPGLADDLIFVAVTTTGESTGSYKGENPTIGVTYYTDKLYAMFMDAMKEIAMSKDVDCQPPRWFIDLHLRLRALEAAIESNNFILACKWWREFHAKPALSTGAKFCNCNGQVR